MGEVNTPLPVKDIDHVEFFVGNAKQAAEYYRLLFGFDLIGYAGPETGIRDQASYLLQQGHIRFVLTTPLTPDSEAARKIHQHGDGVYDIALRVDDAEKVYAEAVRRGAPSVYEPREVRDAEGAMKKAAIQTYGDTIHSLVEKNGYEGPLLPGFRPLDKKGGNQFLKAIDHIVGNVEDGKMNNWAEFYSSVFGFDNFITFDDKDISTEYSALRSKVMASENKRIKFPINEPAPGKKKSQIQEYIEFNRGAGVQHVALITGDIISAIHDLRARGVEFLEVPDTYYETLTERVGEIKEDIEELRKLKILVDRDEDGYLLQLFTKPVEDRPTLFFEVIQRRGCQGFGKGNFKALFESIEREQSRRGNL
ncbi:MAG: 4-hydroxyphenylpyruvate dioxygenase [Candidatus Eisenbacteria bacterium]|uniref:4-hydroxyphenylpyruvate dioxygenase n=1 Tax=Eiseniibacteriota bacterium TaxID=2212470 RepID=A0A956NAV0_UNCEI|nr:4-hydroxyphenylpyruvate dioxygenase [Candidatus Eisenbacteria bacterium]MCB9463195.1 4-hydroxyphenylpyruvate dioxygenase [Candidatus Eisenbacteria bacterium]